MRIWMQCWWPAELQSLGLFLASAQIRDVLWCLRVLWNLNFLEVPGKKHRRKQRKMDPKLRLMGTLPHRADMLKEHFSGSAGGGRVCQQMAAPSNLCTVWTELTNIFFPQWGLDADSSPLVFSIQPVLVELRGLQGFFFPLKQHITYITNWRNIIYSHGSGGGACHSTFIYCSPCENSA